MEVKNSGAVRPSIQSGEWRDAAVMLTAELLRRASVKPAKRIEWREFTERNARGEPHPYGDEHSTARRPY